MRLDHPRIAPLTDAELDHDSRELIETVRGEDGRVLNIFRTLARYPKLAKRWMVFANHVLAKSSLPARERELMILRTGFLCASGYEWAQHVAIGRRTGLSDDEIERIAEGPDAEGWSSSDGLLLAATDELVRDKFISEPTWAALGGHWDEHQLIDLVFAVGQYTLVSMALNTFGVQIEADTDKFPPALFKSGRFPA